MATDKIKANNQRSVYVLSIGINKYKNPHIRNLSGCINDVCRLKKTLQSSLNIPENQYKILLDGHATRQGIIDAFRSHFQNLQDGDIALLHYSGHGSWEKTSSEFIEAGLEPTCGRNETIVCYDSGETNIFDIADKELRMLISELQFPQKNKSKNIHFTCLFDCCHSGSMARKNNPSVNLRTTLKKSLPRQLVSYLEGQYFRMQKLIIPPVNFISISACAPRESAIEYNNNGIFTSAIVQVISKLSNQNQFPSYSEIFCLIREITKKNTNNNQHPHLEYAGKVNPFHAFLLHGEHKKSKYPELFLQDKKWRIAMGAIHGLSFEQVSHLEIPIFEHNQLNKPIAFGSIDQIEVESSTLKKIKPNLSPEDSQSSSLFSIQPILNPEKVYLAAVAGTPLPLKLNIDPTAHTIWNVLNAEFHTASNRNKYIITDSADYEVCISSNQICLLYKNSLLFSIRQTNIYAIQYINHQLSKIHRWEQINSLHTSSRAIIDPDQIELHFSYEDYRGKLHTHLFGDTNQNKSKPFQILLKYNKKLGGIPYTFKVQNNSQNKLFYYLIHLTSQYGIYQKHESYLKGFHWGDLITLYDSKSFHTGLGIVDDWRTEALDTFLLIASVETLDIPFAFEQKGFGVSFGKFINTFHNRKDRTTSPIKGEVLLNSQFNINWVVKRVEVKVCNDKG